MNRVKLPLAAGLVPALLLALCSVAPAQSAAPFERTGDAFVGDPSSDTLWRLQDLTLDGDFLDPGEVVAFYDDVNGTIGLQTNNGVAVGPDGVVYVSDSGADAIIGLLDTNGDGDANDSGEHWIFFDATNSTGIVAASLSNMFVDENSVVWATTADTGGGGIDAILKLQDMNGDGDANDNIGPGLDEAQIYIQFPGLSVGDFIPYDVVRGSNGDLYYLDGGTGVTQSGPSMGTPIKGVWRIRDDNPPDGTITYPDEVYHFWGPMGTSGSNFFWGLGVDSADRFYVADTTQETLFSFQDTNGSNAIEANEEILAWNALAPPYVPVASLIWRVAVESGGMYSSLLAAESQAPDRILRFIDLNGDLDFDDPNEVVAIWDDSLLPIPNIVNPRTIALARAPTLQAPPNPSITLPFDITLDGVQGAFYSLWVSDALALLPAAPYGFVEIDLFPPATAVEFIFGTISTGGRQTFQVPAFLNPAWIGYTVHLQALTGPLARLQLTNSGTISLMP